MPLRIGKRRWGLHASGGRVLERSSPRWRPRVPLLL